MFRVKEGKPIYIYVDLFKLITNHLLPKSLVSPSWSKPFSSMESCPESLANSAYSASISFMQASSSLTILSSILYTYKGNHPQVKHEAYI